MERQALETVETVWDGRPSPRCDGWSVCRDSPVTAAELEPTPGLDQVDQLAEKFRTAGAARCALGDRGGA